MNETPCTFKQQGTTSILLEFRGDKEESFELTDTNQKKQGEKMSYLIFNNFFISRWNEHVISWIFKAHDTKF